MREMSIQGRILIAIGIVILALVAVGFGQVQSASLGYLALGGPDATAVSTPDILPDPGGANSAAGIEEPNADLPLQPTLVPTSTLPPPTFTRTPTQTRLPLPTKTPSGPGAAVGTLSKAARIVIPAIRVDSPVVEMGWKTTEENGRISSEWVVPENEVGHAQNSVNPGERGNVVMAGHNNLFAKVFRKLYTLKPGNEITLYNSVGERFIYLVTQSYLVREAGEPLEKRIENAKVMNPTSDARLTLISCYPEWSNEYRAIVIAQLVDSAP